MKITNHKIVESYWVEELPNGVIHLLINCNTREFYCHNFNDEEYLILSSDRDVDIYDVNDILKIPRFLKGKESVYIYVSSCSIEKDQINYYFIPYQKEWIKNKKFIIE